MIIERRFFHIKFFCYSIHRKVWEGLFPKQDFDSSKKFISCHKIDSVKKIIISMVGLFLEVHHGNVWLFTARIGIKCTKGMPRSSDRNPWKRNFNQYSESDPSYEWKSDGDSDTAFWSPCRTQDTIRWTSDSTSISSRWHSGWWRPFLMPNSFPRSYASWDFLFVLSSNTSSACSSMCFNWISETLWVWYFRRNV